MVFGLFVCQQLDLTAADIGRHLENGRRIWNHPELLKTNFYSYTFPEFPFLNHHWGSGVVFFQIWHWFGWGGLSMFGLGIQLATLYLIWKSVAYVSPRILFGVSLIFLPLLVSRFQVRPEHFSYFFVALYLVLLSVRPFSNRLMVYLVLAQIVWTNLHIYFFLGPILLLVHTLDAWLKDQAYREKVRLGYATILVSAACLLNPLGLTGALAPFRIFENYGLALFENHNMWFLYRVVHLPLSEYFIVIFTLVTGLWMWTVARHRELPVAETALFILAGTMGWMALRNCTLFALLTLPLVARWASRINSKRVPSALKRLETFFVGVVLIAVGVYTFGFARIKWPWQNAGTGLLEGNTASIEFFNQNGLVGPVCNNYNIGSALIWGLGEREKVFIDNRPEAYPARWVQSIYTGMQLDERIWKETLDHYQFNAIFFSLNERAPQTRGFLERRLADPAWATVFLDRYAIILLRQTPNNQPLIQRFELKR